MCRHQTYRTSARDKEEFVKKHKIANTGHNNICSHILIYIGYSIDITIARMQNSTSFFCIHRPLVVWSLSVKKYYLKKKRISKHIRKKRNESHLFSYTILWLLVTGRADGRTNGRYFVRKNTKFYIQIMRYNFSI